MQLTRRVLVGAYCLALTPWLLAQQPTSPQEYLQQALVSIGATGVQSTSLSGNSEFIAGSLDVTGPFTAQCALGGSSQLQLQLPSNSRTESRQTSNGTATGSWIDNEGVTHATAGHNVLTPASWFCPHIALSDILQNQSLNLQFVGQETKNGESVLHLSIAATEPDNTPTSVLMAHLSKTDIYLDAVTFRPVAFDFNIHPDNNAALDIPVEIQFTNYSNASGAWIPYGVEKFVNSSLTLRLQVESASPSATASQVQ
jgi:hypothetical protein